MLLVVVVEAVPGFEDKALGAVFPELAGFVVLEDTDGFVDAAGAAHFLGVEDVAQILCGEPVEVSETMLVVFEVFINHLISLTQGFQFPLDNYKYHHTTQAYVSHLVEHHHHR